MRYFLSILLLLSVFTVSAQKDTTKYDSSRMLKTVVVTGNVTSKALKQQPINVSVVEAKPFYNTNVTGFDLVKQVSGIKVKQDGGFGARTEFFINGSTGKQVKFFIDGLPQDNLGETQLLNIYPVEQIERIEVYKGVLPVDLGADALGAAINIVTRKERENYFDASYSIASFNTHRLNVSAKRYLSEHFFAGIQANTNYAQNNYRIDADVPNRSGNVEIKNVKRFHDVYKNYNVKLQAGFTDRPFADQLVFSIIKTGAYDALQNNLVQTQPYGKAFYKENLVSGIIKYQKANLFKNFNLAAFLSYNRVDGVFTDTSRNIYNWEGRVVDRKFGGGEITSSANDLYINTNVFNGKLTASYRINDNLKLIFSNTFQHYYRTGKDTVAQQFYGGIDYFGTPSSMTKNIAGIGLEGNFLTSKLKFSTALKHYSTQLTGYQMEWATQTVTSQSLHAFAFNIAAGYKLSEHLLFKTSYEHAARLPEAEEAFGDFMLIKSNPKINIEQSENVNLTLLYQHQKLETELTGFYRNVDNIIYLRTSQFGSQYQNLLSAKVLGMEGAVKYQPVNWLHLNANITYQDLRNQSAIDNSGINNDRYKNARLPNIPYLFMNGGAAYKKDHVIRKNTTLQLWWNSSYTNEYYLYWEVDGARELKNRIPTQFLQYAGISYAFTNNGLSLAFEVNNVTNATAYDNFKVQLPGRSYSFKIRIYQFNK